jgi:hypothetical protein
LDKVEPIQKKPTFRERINSKLGRDKTKESEAVKELKEFLDGRNVELGSVIGDIGGKTWSKYLKDSTKEELVKLLDNFKSEKVKVGVSDAIMTLLVWNYNNSKEEELKKSEVTHKLRMMANRTINLMNSEQFIKIVNKASRELSEYIDDYSVSNALYSLIVDPNFTKIGVYSTWDLDIYRKKLVSAYKNYKSYCDFFEKLGFQLHPFKIFINTSEKTSAAYQPQRDIIKVSRNAAFYDIDSGMAHEITHSLQFSGKKKISYGKDYGGENDKSGMQLKPDTLTDILLEVGTVFIESVYNFSSYQVGRANGTATKVPMLVCGNIPASMLLSPNIADSRSLFGRTVKRTFAVPKVLYRNLDDINLYKISKYLKYDPETERFYFEIHLNPNKIPPSLLLEGLKFETESIFNTGFNSKYDFKGWIGEIYKTLKESEPADIHTAFYRLVKSDYERYGQNKYLIAYALAALTFACNDFDVKKTAVDLINIDKPYLLIEKLADIIKEDKDSLILNSILTIK